MIQDAKGGVNGTENEAVFDGPGWISGSLAGVTLGGRYLRAAPRDDAVHVADMINGKKGYGPDSFQVKRILACDGRFLEVVAVPPAGAAVRGWSRLNCTNQLTTCDTGGEE